MKDLFGFLVFGAIGFFAGEVFILVSQENEDKSLIAAGKTPIHHSIGYYHEENPEWFICES